MFTRQQLGHATSRSSRGRRGTRGCRSTRGFTLVELMVVIVILGGLIAIVGPNVYRALKDADVNRAKTQMANFNTAIGLYLIANRKLPESLEELMEVDPQTGEAFIKDVPLDPWQNEYQLKVLDRTNDEFEILSFGRDMAEGTEDDIVFPERRQE